VGLLDKRLDLDAQIEVFDHLDRCGICYEAVYLIARDRDWSTYGQQIRDSEPFLKAS
jgi:hypothetical protein